MLAFQWSRCATLAYLRHDARSCQQVCSATLHSPRALSLTRWFPLPTTAGLARQRRVLAAKVATEVPPPTTDSVLHWAQRPPPPKDGSGSMASGSPRSSGHNTPKPRRARPSSALPRLGDDSKESRHHGQGQPAGRQRRRPQSAVVDASGNAHVSAAAQGRARGSRPAGRRRRPVSAMGLRGF